MGTFKWAKPVLGQPGRTLSNLATAGFTLIELLAVIAVLVLLLAMLMPSLQGAKEMAKTSQCISNMRQQGHLSNLYSSEYSGYVVPANVPTGYTIDPNLEAQGANYIDTCKPVHTGNGGGSWGITFDEQLMFFLGQPLSPASSWGQPRIIAAFQCPSGPWGMEEASSAVFNDRFSGIYHPYYDWLPANPAITPASAVQVRSWIGHYGINSHQSSDLSKSKVWDGATWSDVRNVDPRRAQHPMAGRGMKTTQWEDAAGTILTMETWRLFGWGHAGGLGMQISGPLQAGINSGWVKAFAPHSQGIGLYQEKHLGKTNLLFCDGHAATMKMADTLGPGQNIMLVDPWSVRGMWTRYSGD